MYRVIIVIVAYIAAQMLADIGALRIVTLAGLSIDAGTFIYPLTFTLRDLIHKTIGAAGARVLIVSAAVVNLFMAAYFAFAASLPPDMEVGPQREFGIVLAPVWRIVLASIVAEVISEWVDTEAYSLWMARMGYKNQWARVLFSNSISAPLDSALFVALAFIGALPIEVVLSLFLSNTLIKFVVSIVGMPLIYLVPERRAAA